MSETTYEAWIVECTKCEYEFKTKALVPCCSKCHSQDHIKYLRKAVGA